MLTSVITRFESNGVKPVFQNQLYNQKFNNTKWNMMAKINVLNIERIDGI